MKNIYNPSTLLTINNDGKAIIDSDYWVSAVAQAGYYFVSTNAGCLRLMVPSPMAREIPDMVKGAKAVVISILKGYQNAHGREVLSITIEDGSDFPYNLSFGLGSFDMLPSEADRKGPWAFAIWGLKNGRPHKFMERPAFVRYVDSLPCLQPYDPAVD